MVKVRKSRIGSKKIGRQICHNAREIPKRISGGKYFWENSVEAERLRNFLRNHPPFEAGRSDGVLPVSGMDRGLDEIVDGLNA